MTQCHGHVEPTRFPKNSLELPRYDVLFPIRLDDEIMRTNAAWAASVRRQRLNGDFRAWAEPESYKAGFDQLLDDLRTGKQQL